MPPELAFEESFREWKTTGAFPISNVPRSPDIGNFALFSNHLDA